MYEHEGIISDAASTVTNLLWQVQKQIRFGQQSNFKYAVVDISEQTLL